MCSSHTPHMPLSADAVILPLRKKHSQTQEDIFIFKVHLLVNGLARIRPERHGLYSHLMFSPAGRSDDMSAVNAPTDGVGWSVIEDNL